MKIGGIKVDKDEYVRRSLSKIRHKPWELYVISRVIHRLNDPDIEFVPQQLVRLANGNRALTDLYFPQFNLHLEVNEGYHFGQVQVEADEKRKSDIIVATGHEIRTIHVAQLTDQISTENLPLASVDAETEDFIHYLRQRKAEALESHNFEPWNMDARYNPQRHIEAGYISRLKYVAVRHQRDALRCFGYPEDGGHYRRAIWNVPGRPRHVIWFPRLYPHGEWSNALSNGGTLIIERPQSEKARTRIKETLNAEDFDRSRIVFAKFEDPLGAKLFQYVGTFKINMKTSTPDEVRFNLISDDECTA